MTAKSWNQIKTRRLKKPAVKEGYDRARRAYELAEKVRALREERGISQAELARRIGSTQPAVARLEGGGVAPSIETLERIAIALDLELTIRFTKSSGPSGRHRSSIHARSA